MSKEKIEVGDWVRLLGYGWREEYPEAPEYVRVTEVSSGPYGIIRAEGVQDVGDNDRLFDSGHDTVPEYACEWVPEIEVPAEIRFKGHPSTHSTPVSGEENITSFTQATEKLADVYFHDPVDPKHYQFPSGVEVRQISGYLTGFGAQALQYVARATRMDESNKGDRIEDLRKSIKFIEWEIERLEETK